MKLNVSGHPLHSRSLTVGTRHCEDGRHALTAAVVDLRKCCFVPVAGMLQPSGIIHHMTLEGVIDPARRVLEKLAGDQPTKAFEPAAITRGECCFDPVHRLEELSGETLDDRFVARLSQVFGKDRGCSHLLALAQLAASTAVTALDWDESQPAVHTDRRAGERVFHRAVEIDGFEREAERQMILSVQLTDLHFRAAPAIAFPMDHFGAETEVRVLARVELARGMTLSQLQVFERRRNYDEIETAAWRDRSEELSPLMGQSVMSGMSRRLLELLGGRREDRPLLDALLSLAPGFIQCLASLSESWPAAAKARPDLLGMQGRVGSCHMWREGGALHRVSQDEVAETGD
jgi:hypothetical protein